MSLKKQKMDIEESKNTIAVQEISGKGAHFQSFEEYEKLYKRSIEDNDGFWDDMAKQQIDFFAPYTKVKQGEFKHGNIGWFLNGKLNVSYNCVDRHAEATPDKVAILFEGDEPDDIRRITYAELLREVCTFANSLKSLGVRKGDSVCLYMPMVPEAAIAMLACTRIGAPHSVVFAGFSSEALRDRIIDGHCKFVITADEGVRGGRIIPLKKTVDEALHECPDVKHCVVLKRTGNSINFQGEHDPEKPFGRDVWWHEINKTQRPYCPPEWMDSEDPLFYLYTSGSTGKPKGLAHTTAGYLLYTSLTHKYVFDYRDGDIYACVADVGWITGHSYIVYGPLCNGATTFMFESTPLYPNAGRYWDMIERHKITQFYTAPTAIRALMKYGEEPVKKYNRSTLRVMGTVGEPINPEAWKWYYDVVGDSKRSIVDTYWQTETGGIIVTSLPGATPMKPGSATFPFFGIDLGLMDDKGVEIKGNDKSGVLVVKKPWPGGARTIYGNHERFLNTYMTAYPGTYFTSDGCTRDADGYYWITGRVDDVINVSGHRIGSAEVESALVAHNCVAEAAVVGVPHSVKGQALFAYVIPKNGVSASKELEVELQLAVKNGVGSFAKPDHVLVTPALPKTRSGKIMRRLLRKIACQETEPAQLGDISTLADPSVVEKLIEEANIKLNASKK